MWLTGRRSRPSPVTGRGPSRGCPCSRACFRISRWPDAHVAGSSGPPPQDDRSVRYRRVALTMPAGHTSSADGLVLDAVLPVKYTRMRPSRRSRSVPRVSRLVGALAAALASWSAPAWPQASLPNPFSTPGALNPAVTQATISSTICRSGYAATMRPPAWVTSAVKERQLRAAGLPAASENAYEEDHLIPLELGGAPAADLNLWPQPRRPSDGWDARRKDNLEGILHGEVCAGRLQLAEAHGR